MNKFLTLTFSIFIIWAPSWAQDQGSQLPAAFTWQNLLLTSGVRADFTTPARTQPYQGPCLSFAIASAIETRYMLEQNNTQMNPNLNVPYLDYYAWSSQDFRQLLQTNGFGIADDNCGNFPPNCSELICNPNIGSECGENGCLDENGHKLNAQVTPIVSAGNCFNISYQLSEITHRPYWTVQSLSAFGNRYQVQTVDQNLPFTNLEQIKWSIIHEGPLVVMVQDHANVARFRDYSSSVNSYHAYAIMGWRTVNGAVQWHLKDSWNGAAGFVYSKSNPGMISMIQRGKIHTFQVAGIQKNGAAPGQGWPSFSPASQGPQLPPLTISLRSWDYGADKGVCVDVSGSSNYTLDWHVTGSTALDTYRNCATIINPSFSGTITVTAREGNRSATESVRFTATNNPW